MWIALSLCLWVRSRFQPTFHQSRGLAKRNLSFLRALWVLLLWGGHWRITSLATSTWEIKILSKTTEDVFVVDLHRKNRSRNFLGFQTDLFAFSLLYPWGSLTYLNIWHCGPGQVMIALHRIHLERWYSLRKDLCQVQISGVKSSLNQKYFAKATTLGFRFTNSIAFLLAWIPPSE